MEEPESDSGKIQAKTFWISARASTPCPRFAWTCEPGCLSSYPDNDYRRLKECIAQVFHRNTDEICVGNGSIELIRVFCSIVLSSKKTYHTTSPTFGEYELSARLCRCRGSRQAGDRGCFFCLQSQQSDR